jgi:hypothetical protein
LITRRARREEHDEKSERPEHPRAGWLAKRPRDHYAVRMSLSFCVSR